MATTREQYVAKCNEIYEAQPTYKVGASDKNECDCIGMTKYGLRENGVKFSTTGTNYTMRNQVENVREINSVSDLAVGDVVFKALEPGDSNYALPDKYKPGGSGYNGDLRDYNHIGTVKSVNPLQIIHMTSPSAKCDTKIGRWRFCASLKKEYISDEPGPGPEPPVPPEPAKTKYVYAENGKPVNLRKSPNKGAALVDRIPVGEEVEWLKGEDGWSYLKWKGKYGWMMDEFLVDEMPGPGPSPEPPEPTPTPTPVVHEYAMVWSENGKAVNTRKGPDESYAQSMAGKIPVGEIVEVIGDTTNKQGEDWCKIVWKDPRNATWTCWMKACFLKPVGSPDPEPEPEPDPGEETFAVVIPDLSEDEALEIKQKYPGAYIVAG